MADTTTAGTNSELVTTGKPKVAGAIFAAPLGTTLPTDATTALDAAFKSLGYISEDGVTNSESMENSTVKAWGGDPVLNSMTSKEDVVKFTMIETMNSNVAKLRYGDDNVSGDLDTGMTIKSLATQPVGHALVIDMVLKGNVLKRIVYPNVVVTSTDDITYKDGDVTGYGVTLSAEPDAASATHYEYLVKKASAA